jgi:hypothetical protein
MASLMQKFAEARKRRLQERADFVVDSQLASESRQEEIQIRSSQMSQHLQDLCIVRTEQAIEDSARRAQDVRTRTFKTRSLLKHIHKARIRTSLADNVLRQQFEADRLANAEVEREQRQQFEADRVVTAEADSILRQQQVQERAAFTQMQLEDFTKTRLTNATLAAQQRLEVESSRRADAQNQALKLRAFRSNLRDSVWGTSSSSSGVIQAPAKISAKSSPDISKKSTTALKTKVAAQIKELLVIKPVEAKPLVEVKQTVKEIAKEAPKTSSKIEQFVFDYVAQLSTSSSLLEVVNDRDTVRDLLAQGANTLKVDPSDILNTLLQMAEAS